MGKVLSRCTKKTTMMTNLVAKDFLKETVFLPPLAEQKRIGILLNTLDKFITLHQKKPFLQNNTQANPAIDRITRSISLFSIS